MDPVGRAAAALSASTQRVSTSMSSSHRGVAQSTGRQSTVHQTATNMTRSGRSSSATTFKQRRTSTSRSVHMSEAASPPRSRSPDRSFLAQEQDVRDQILRAAPPPDENTEPVHDSTYSFKREHRRSRRMGHSHAHTHAAGRSSTQKSFQSSRQVEMQVSCLCVFYCVI